MRILQTNTRPEPVDFSRFNFKSQYLEMIREWGSSWREGLHVKNLSLDFLAGLTVAAVALPLNLALAVAAGLPPSTGLIAGAIGGGFAALFGGARFQVSGPAAALNVMVFLLVKDFGPAGAAAAALIAGVISLLLSFLLAGKLVRYIPEAVLAGFTSAVGIKLLDQQIPEVLGFDYTVLEIAAVLHRPSWLHDVSWLAVVCGLTVALIVLTTRHFKRFPGALLGVSVVTALSVYLNWRLERVGNIPPVLPTISFPNLQDDQWLPLFLRAIPLGLLAAVESLLSATVLDRMTHAKVPHNSNLELFGQGLANLAAGLTGGMPVTGVVVRSSANVQSGAKTRLSAFFHALILLLSVLYLSDQLAKIPLAALAGLLCVIGFRLIEFKELAHLVLTNRVDAAAFVITLLGTLSGHLVLGLSLGIGIHHVGRWFYRRERQEESEKAELASQGIRAVVGSQRAEARRPTHYEPAMIGSGIRNWLSNVQGEAHIPKSAYVHPEASVIGRVVLGPGVHVAADTSIRADEGTPFFIGENSNVQDGVVLHALKERHVRVGAEKWAIYVGKNVSMAHQALVHGPCYIGDHTFVGFKAVVHDSVVGSNCFIGIGAVVVGVEIPDGRFVPHGAIIDSADKVDALGPVSHAHTHFNTDVVEVNRGLAAAYLRSEGETAKSSGRHLDRIRPGLGDRTDGALRTAALDRF
jgi:SulP family sulfate permease